MRAELELIQTIERYLQGEMEALEKAAFEKRIAVEVQLKEEVELQEQLMRGIERVILKQNAKQAYRKYRAENNFLRWGLTGLGVILLSGAIYMATDTSVQKPEQVEVAKERVSVIVEEKSNESVPVSAPMISSSVPVSVPSINNVSKVTNAIKATTVKDLYKHFEKPFQVFNIMAGKDTVIKCAEGTTIKIEANSFALERNGGKAEGVVQLRVREYYKNSDIILANLSTNTSKEILETGGMLYIEASSKGEFCKLKNGKEIELGFPYVEKKKDMKLFEGKRDSADRIEWALAENKQLAALKNVLPQYGMPIESNEIYTIVEEEPKFSEGNEGLLKYIKKSIAYPEDAREEGISGTVYVSFVIDEKGQVSDAKVARSISPSLDKEAIRVVRSMPKWTPGLLNGAPSKIRYTLPINFQIDGERNRKYTGDTALVVAGLTSSLPYSWLAIEASKKQQDSIARSNFEKNNSNANIQKAKISDMSRYLLSSSKLGWINCDRFIYDNRPKANYFVRYEATKNADVKLLFHSSKSVMPSFTMNDGRSLFNSVPIGEKVTIVAFKYENGEPMLAVKESVVSKAGESALAFEHVTMEKLKAEMEKLDKIN